MKTVYIIAFTFLSFTVYAQENKVQEAEDQSKVLRDLKENERRMLQEMELHSPKKEKVTYLVSENGLAVKEEKTKPQTSSASQGKKLPSTASFDEILTTIPNRQNSHNASSTSKTVQGLPNTATLAEIKKTIPRNQ